MNSGLHVPPGFPDSTCAIVQATNNTNNPIAHLAGWAMVRTKGNNDAAAVVSTLVIAAVVVVVVIGGRRGRGGR